MAANRFLGLYYNVLKLGVLTKLQKMHDIKVVLFLQVNEHTLMNKWFQLHWMLLNITNYA